MRSDRPSDSKKGGVFIYSNEHIPLIFLICIYRSSIQTPDEFLKFSTHFDIFLNNITDELPLCLIFTGDIMLVALGNGRMISPTLKVRNWTPLYYQLDIIKLQRSLQML